MANALYDLARQSFLSQSPALDWDTDNIKVMLVDITAAYTVNLATHQFQSSIVAGDREATSPNLGSKTVAAGVADAAGTTFTAVSSAQDVSGALVIFKDTGGADTTNPLIVYIDTATGLPVTPNNGDINVAWNTGANKIFKL
jgi:hypothetical protein